MVLLTIIQPADTLGLWAIIIGVAAIAISLEQKYSWAAKITGCVIAMGSAIVLSNTGVLPTHSPVYDDVWQFIVPLAIPLLLFKANLKTIGKESGRLVVIFLISSVGTIVGGIVGFFILKSYVPDLYKVAAMIAGSYIGGSVNFAAMSDAFHVAPDTVSAAVIADNLLMVVYFFVLIFIPTTTIMLRLFSHPHIDALGVKGEEDNHAVDYWKGQEISLKDMATTLAYGFAIVWVSSLVGDYIQSRLYLPEILRTLFGNKYLVMTTITMILATGYPKKFESMAGSQEMGTFIIYIFFVVIGIPASVQLIIDKSPWLLVYCSIMVFVNMVVTFVFGKIFRFDLEEIIIASNANIGGPTTAAAMAIAKGWKLLVLPAILVGILGYVIGNYAGILMGDFLMFK